MTDEELDEIFSEVMAREIREYRRAMSQRKMVRNLVFYVAGMMTGAMIYLIY